MLLDAVLLAGGQMSLVDPLFAEAPEGYRSLIDVRGKPMAQWVLDALSDSANINTIYVMGLPPTCGLTSDKPLIFIEESGGLFENIRVGVLRAAEDHPEQHKTVIASGDLPAVNGVMVDWLIQKVIEQPNILLYYNVVSRDTMEKRFPESNRSYVHFKDLSVCGGDLNVVDKDLFTTERPLWKQLSEARKSPLRQAALLGWDSLFLVAFRLVTLQGAVKRVCKKLSVTGLALVNPYAEMAMDADKPHQLAILRKDLG